MKRKNAHAPANDTGRESPGNAVEQPDAETSGDTSGQPILSSVYQSILSPRELQRVTQIVEAMHEVFPAPIDAWIADFQCEKSPESLIHIAEASVAVLKDVCTRVTLMRNQKMDLFLVMMAIPDCMDGQLKELARDLPKVKGIPSIAKLRDMFWDAWAPLEKELRPNRKRKRSPLEFGL
jgi:hypothetical protein